MMYATGLAMAKLGVGATPLAGTPEAPGETV